MNASDNLQAGGGYGVLYGKEPTKNHDYTLQIGDSGAESIGVVISHGDKVTNCKIGQTVGLFGFGVGFRE